MAKAKSTRAAAALAVGDDVMVLSMNTGIAKIFKIIDTDLIVVDLGSGLMMVKLSDVKKV